MKIDVPFCTFFFIDFHSSVHGMNRYYYCDGSDFDWGVTRMIVVVVVVVVVVAVVVVAVPVVALVHDWVPGTHPDGAMPEMKHPRSGHFAGRYRDHLH